MKKTREVINCDTIDKISQGQINYDKNIVDLMKDKVILDIKEYEKLIKHEITYTLQYNSLYKEIEAEFERKYEGIIRDHKNRLDNMRKDRDNISDKYDDLLEATLKYRRTNWWKRNLPSFCRW